MSRRYDWARYGSLFDVRLLDSLTSILSSLFLFIFILTSIRFCERLTVTGSGRFLVSLAWSVREAGGGPNDDFGGRLYW